MNITVNENEQAITISIEGEVDTKEAELIKKKFLEILPKVEELLILDFSGVTFIGSSGIGKILSLYKNLSQQNKTLIIDNMNDNIYHLFVSFKLDKLFEIRKRND